VTLASRWRWWGAVAIAVLSWSAGRTQTGVSDPRPADAMDAILRAFDQKPIVALAEAHSLQEEHDVIVRLLRDPRFADAVRLIVVEWANALYQDSIDRYVAGEAEPKDRVSRAWRNTGFSPLAPWDAPVYERFFDVVREVNQSRPPGRRLRVIAADPPVDWSTTREEIEATQKRFRAGASAALPTHHRRRVAGLLLHQGAIDEVLQGGGSMPR
jgi:hypothetical protein